MGCGGGVVAALTPLTPSIAFRHLPPNSAGFRYATEVALFISAQLSTDAVSALRKVWVKTDHTPSIAFRHLPPNSARFSYATEGALFISAQLSTDAVSALRRKVWILVRLWKQPSAEARTYLHETHPPWV